MLVYLYSWLMMIHFGWFVTRLVTWFFMWIYWTKNSSLANSFLWWLCSLTMGISRNGVYYTKKGKLGFLNLVMQKYDTKPSFVAKPCFFVGNFHTVGTRNWGGTNVGTIDLRIHIFFRRGTPFFSKLPPILTANVFLVGGLEHGWMIFPSSWEFNWRTPSFFSER